MPHLPPPENDSERLDRILMHIQRIDSRDKMRTWGGFLKSIITIGLIVWSTWYFYVHGEELMTKIAETAANQAKKASESQAQDIMLQFQQLQGGAGVRRP
jgi:hypothetical protein